MSRQRLTFLETIERLRHEVDSKIIIDVSTGAEDVVKVSRIRFVNAVRALCEKGYSSYYVRTTQQGTGKPITLKVLTVPGKTYQDVFLHPDEIKQIA